MNREGHRKVRSDKKIDVKPTLSIRLKDLIYSLSYVTHTPVKMVGEELCLFVLHNDDMIKSLSPYFQRSFKMGSTLFMGSNKNLQMPKRIPGNNEKISIRFKQRDYNYIYDVAYVLGVSASRLVGILIQMAARDGKIIDWYVNKTVEGYMSDNQIKEFEKIKKSLSP